MALGDEVPADFTAFVAAHEDALRTACRELTGHGQLGDLLARDLLAAVALRWRLLPPTVRARVGTARLDRLLRRETRAWRQRDRAQSGPGRIHVLVDAATNTSVTADQAWRRARGLRRGRAALAAAVVVALAWVALAGSRPAMPAPPDIGPVPVPVPAGVRVLPRFEALAALSRRTTVLPADLDVSGGAPTLADRPVRRAVAVLRRPGGPLFVVGEDGAVRTVDDARVTRAELLSSSLSPDGTKVALLGATLLVLDVATGNLASFAFLAGAPALAWSGARTVVMPVGGDSVEVNVDSGASVALAGVRAIDVVSRRGPANSTLTELVPALASLTSPPRIRSWRGGTFDDLPVFGPPWIGDWSGLGWSTKDFLVRRCSPGTITLPTGPAGAALGVVHANGLYAATLATSEAIDLDVLGFTDTDTVLVDAFSDTATEILAWQPLSGTVQLVATVNGSVRISVVDLTPSGS